MIEKETGRRNDIKYPDVHPWVKGAAWFLSVSFGLLATGLVAWIGTVRDEAVVRSEHNAADIRELRQWIREVRTDPDARYDSFTGTEARKMEARLIRIMEIMVQQQYEPETYE